MFPGLSLVRHRRGVTSRRCGPSNARSTQRTVDARGRGGTPEARSAADLRASSVAPLLRPHRSGAQASTRQFAGKFQQLTAPVTAKGIEDTAFYIYNRLRLASTKSAASRRTSGLRRTSCTRISPTGRRTGRTRCRRLSTHDTKRSEDVRARINVLSEMPDEWARARHGDGASSTPGMREFAGDAPDRNEEYLIYQTLIGAWPLEPWAAEEYDAFVKRVQAYMVKAMREAKVQHELDEPERRARRGRRRRSSQPSSTKPAAASSSPTSARFASASAIWG